MKTKYVICVFLLALAKLAFCQESPDQNASDDYVQISLTVKVVDENGAAVKDADIHVRVIYPERYKDGSNDFHGKSNEAGEFLMESKTTSYTVPISVKKDGYYNSVMEYQYGYELNQTTKAYDRVMPWNPTVPAILKKIGKGAPMYVRISERKPVFVPSQNLAHGYDLLEDDWVAPHGSGKVADLSIRARMNSTDADQHDGEMSIAFANKGDGHITLHELKGIESELKYPREAPLDGYVAEPIIMRDRSQNPDDVQGPDGGHPYGYIFRIRTRYDKDGNVVSAIYAKVIGRNLRPPSNRKKLESPIEFGYHPGLMKQDGKESGCYFSIYYCLNPAPNDRTLEVDRKIYLGNQRDIPPSNFAP